MVAATKSNIIKFPDKGSRSGCVTKASVMAIPKENFGILQPPMGYDVMKVLAGGRIVAIQSNSALAGCYPPIYFDTVSEVWRYIIDPTSDGEDDKPKGAA